MTADWRRAIGQELRWAYDALAAAIGEVEHSLTDEERTRLLLLTRHAVDAVWSGDVDGYAVLHLAASEIVVDVRTRRDRGHAIIAAYRPRIEALRAESEAADVPPSAADIVHWSLVEARDAVCRGETAIADEALRVARLHLPLPVEPRRRPM
jgi:hypothetical protein